jgi:hypothetical protein
MTRVVGDSRRTLYGLALGVIMLDTRFPRLPGDVGYAPTWPFPVHYRVVSGALPERMAQPSPDPALLQPFIDAACELEAAGVRAIITSCGFLAASQLELAAAVSIPVFSSPLLQVPVAARHLHDGQRVAILTARTVLGERHFRGTGWSADEIPIVQIAPPADSHFLATFVGNAEEADGALLEAEVRELAISVVRDHPDVGAIVLECANFAPFGPLFRRLTGLPVFDPYTLGMYAYLATTGVSFAPAS